MCVKPPKPIMPNQINITRRLLRAVQFVDATVDQFLADRFILERADLVHIVSGLNFKELSVKELCFGHETELSRFIYFSYLIVMADKHCSIFIRAMSADLKSKGKAKQKVTATAPEALAAEMVALAAKRP